VLQLIDRQVELVRSWRADLEKKEKEDASDYSSSIYAQMLSELFREIHDASLRWLTRCRERIAATSEDTVSVRAGASGKVAGAIKRTDLGRSLA
jgi:hypothetical protein